MTSRGPEKSLACYFLVRCCTRTSFVAGRCGVGASCAEATIHLVVKYPIYCFMEKQHQKLSATLLHASFAIIL